MSLHVIKEREHRMRWICGGSPLEWLCSPVYWNSNTRQMARVDIVRYTGAMALITRTANVQARVTPEIKTASEYVLRRIGLNMTEAMELFLRRMIVDQKIPFEVVALDDSILAMVTKASELELAGIEKSIPMGAPAKRRRPRQKRE
jgi:DNA-damage-inducible protein J